MTHPQYMSMALRLLRNAGNAQAIHGALCHALDGTPHLWCLMDDCLIVKPRYPKDWDQIVPPHQATHIAGMHVKYAELSEYPVPPTGAPVKFGLVGNPTIAKAQKQGRSRREPLPENQWNAWLERKLGDALNLREIQAKALKPAIAYKPTGRIVHHRVHFTGEATVKNHDTLASLIEHGVGRGKAYGCGLLLVVPA